MINSVTVMAILKLPQVYHNCHNSPIATRWRAQAFQLMIKKYTLFYEQRFFQLSLGVA